MFRIVSAFLLSSLIPLSASADWRHNVRVRQRWQRTTALRLQNALSNAILQGIGPDAETWLRVGSAAKALELSGTKFSDWRRGQGNISVKEGLRAAEVLHSAPWFLLGWDLLSREYWDSVVDYDSGQIEPAVLRELPGSLFREMVQAARANFRLEISRPEDHMFEPAGCAAGLTSAEMIKTLQSRGFSVSPLKRD